MYKQFAQDPASPCAIKLKSTSNVEDPHYLVGYPVWLAGWCLLPGCGGNSTAFEVAEQAASVIHTLVYKERVSNPSLFPHFGS
jgi:hypothetical protein